MQSKKTTLLLIKILEKIVSDRTLHSHWLNTLSFLEYIGTRKMIKSLPASSLNETLLEHMNEESRHSLFFKRLAKKLSSVDLSFNQNEMIASQSAERYFQQIDKHAQNVSQSNTMLNYLYTTYIVESRAVLVYSIYNKILKRNDIPFSIHPILKDEEKHLQYVIESIKELDPLFDYNFEQLRDYEHQVYFSLLRDLEEKVLKVQSSLILNNYQKKSLQEQRP